MVAHWWGLPWARRGGTRATALQLVCPYLCIASPANTAQDEVVDAESIPVVHAIPESVLLPPHSIVCRHSTSKNEADNLLEQPILIDFFDTSCHHFANFLVVHQY